MILFWRRTPEPKQLNRNRPKSVPQAKKPFGKQTTKHEETVSWVVQTSDEESILKHIKYTCIYLH